MPEEWPHKDIPGNLVALNDALVIADLEMFAVVDGVGERAMPIPMAVSGCPEGLYFKQFLIAFVTCKKKTKKNTR